MNWEEAQQQALELGFVFEERHWIPDGYMEDEDGNDTRKLITKPVTMMMVTYPDDYPHPFTMISIGDIKGVCYAINEYLNREKIWEETRRHNKEMETAMKSWTDLLARKPVV